jgi:hypothetical protein
VPALGVELFNVCKRHGISAKALGFNGCEVAATVPAAKQASVAADPAVAKIFQQLLAAEKLGAWLDTLGPCRCACVCLFVHVYVCRLFVCVRLHL